GPQGDREAEVFQVSNDDTGVAQRRLEDKQPEEKTNTDCLLARDREQHLACELFGYREDSNEAAFAVAIVEKIYAHESLTFNNTVFCEVISKWKAGLKDDMDARSYVYVLSNGCKKCTDDSDGYYWEWYTLRVSQSRFYNEKLVQTLLEGHSILSLKGSLSGDCDVEKNGKWSCIYAVGSQEYQTVCTRLNIAFVDVCMLDKFDCGLQPDVQVFVNFDYAMGRSITVMESRYELSLVVGIATGALVKDGSRSEVPAEVEVVAEDRNEVAFAVSVVDKIYAHKSLTFNDTVACEVIFKWKAGLKEDMGVRSDVYVLNNGCRKSSDDTHDYYWEYAPSNGNVLGLEIIRDQGGNTLRVSQSRIHNEKLVKTLLKGHFTLSLEDSLSWVIMWKRMVFVNFDYVMSRSIIGYGFMIPRCVGSLKANLQHMKALSTIKAGYMTFIRVEIIRDRGGNTLRVSQSRIYNEKLVKTLLKGHSTLLLKHSLSGDYDVKRM
nr:zinc finger, CCHC-type [Tanacetum cinerariifolium]